MYINNQSYRSKKSYNSRIRFLVFHYTAGNFESSINTLTGPSVSAHYLIPDFADPGYLKAGFAVPQVFNLVDENQRAWHAGVSSWGNRSNLNDTSIGVEVVNLATDNQGQFTFPPYKAQQIEAIEYLEKNDLITIPPLARESWRMEMMSPERQLVNPFFTGGEVISVSYPTNTMSHEAKLMSMRGNNPHFSRATVQHELIPGHHLQGFMTQRYKPYRGLFSTPFWGEGWALYWELLLWDRGFAKTPEDKIGMLFWRSHRCARIIFSLSFHLEKMTPQQCIDLLVNRVGHEPENAAGEVRRSFAGSYSPLYQAAYLLGGMQIHALRRRRRGSDHRQQREY